MDEHLLADVEGMLRRRIGLNPASLSEGSVAEAVRQRMASLRAAETAAYVRRLTRDDEEFGELVEQLIVPETWFFRDVRPFRCLREFVADRWLPRRSTDALRVLSVPCSTGEEAYSIAMTLAETGLSQGQFTVDGVDVSRRVLAKAADGVYCERSFREADELCLALRDRYCRNSSDRYAVEPDLRSSVRFRYGNLVSTDFLAREPRYHVVFCRNLLIYLDDDARRRALANVRRLLHPEGLFYVGHVEAAIVDRDRFGPFDPRFPFAFQPAAAGAKPPRRPIPAAPIAAKPKPALAPVAARPANATAATRRRAEPPAPRPIPPRTSPQVGKCRAGVEQMAAAAPPVCEIDKARACADSGRLDEAEAVCADLLVKCPPCPDLYCLKGVLELARGAGSEAERSFQKALYLDPRHHEALVHMMLLAEQRGDDQMAANFRRRAEQAARREIRQ